jgi:DNA invertase Pin-like site-specific DNA recombinase
MNPKISDDHLIRRAVVYVRQSTATQLQLNQESRVRQYSLATHARDLGFADVETIDDDLGRSASGLEERPGFQRLVAEVCSGRVGAVLCIEASRLARNGRDWHHLIELCGLAGALVIDPDGVYDPRLVNDRLLLGLKGTMNEFELNLMRQRSLEAIRQKARRGELRCRIPVGFCWTLDGKIEMEPDGRVQQAIRQVFDKFAELGSARQVFLWFRAERLSVPVLWYDQFGPKIQWRPPIYRSIVAMLGNPVYAGAYAYGKTEARTMVVEGRARRTVGNRKPRDQWTVLIRDHHPAYIKWEQYERNQELLAENRYVRHPAGRKAGRGGQSLLTGLLRCGLCGRMMYVNYGGRHRTIARYRCLGARGHEHTETCLAFAASRPDKEVAAAILLAVEPSAIEAAVAAAERAVQEPTERRRALELELEQARYQARLAGRRYEAVDPDNRLVVGELEARWNATLEQVRDLEHSLSELDAASRATVLPDKELLLSLAEDLPAVWSSSNEMGLKQRIARILIEEIVAGVDVKASQLILIIHWAGGRHSELRLKKSRLGEHGRQNDANVMELIRELAGHCPDELIAATLNRLGLRTGKGNTWKKHRIASVRSYLNLPAYDGDAPLKTLNAAQAAKRLCIDTRTVHELLKQGRIPGRQVIRFAPWQIPVEALETPVVLEMVRNIKAGNVTRRRNADDTETLALPGMD